MEDEIGRIATQQLAGVAFHFGAAGEFESETTDSPTGVLQGALEPRNGAPRRKQQRQLFLGRMHGAKNGSVPDVQQCGYRLYL